MNIQELSAALAARKTTSVDLVKAAFKRIDETKEFNAIGVTSPKALELAKQLDEERSIGRLRGPLHGIPVVIKDNILYQDGTPTTANSYALRDLMPPYNALIVERMIAAGAIIVAKANLSELANFLTTEGMPNGYGSMYGQVKHPYDESVDPLGSSTGSAVAVALDIVPVSIGSETNGSLMAPALVQSGCHLKTDTRRGPATRNHSDFTKSRYGRTDGENRQRRRFDDGCHQWQTRWRHPLVATTKRQGPFG